MIAGERPEEFIESAQPFMKLMMQYQCAMLEVQTKFEVLNTELSMDSDRNPIESISCRIKKPMSIVEKLKRKGVEVSLSSIEKNLHDVAGIRVVCFFPKDIYRLAEKICSQDDIRLIEKKDYIQNPKPNGYRSLHLILEVPVFFADEKKWMQVEVQFRTIAMDFWASIEHKVKYKKDIDASTSDIVEKLRGCAESIHSIDLRMQEISECIEASN
nr:GTP pyrophosphokinase family protein [Blautia caecimuris]